MERYSSMLQGLGQTMRLRIFRLLVRAGPEGLVVEQIVRRLRIPGSTLSHHLDTLVRCGLLRSRRESRFIRYSINWARTGALIRFLTEDCCAGFDGHGPTPERGPRSPRSTKPVRVRSPRGDSR